MADPLALVLGGVALLAAGALFCTLAARTWPVLNVVLAGILGGLLGGSAVGYFSSMSLLVGIGAAALGAVLAVAADHLAEAGVPMSLSLLVTATWLAAWSGWRGSTLIYPLIVASVLVFCLALAAMKYAPSVVFAATGAIALLLGIVLVGAYANEDWSSTGMVVALLAFLGGLALQDIEIARLREDERGKERKRVSLLAPPPAPKEVAVASRSSP